MPLRLGTLDVIWATPLDLPKEHLLLIGKASKRRKPKQTRSTSAGVSATTAKRADEIVHASESALAVEAPSSASKHAPARSAAAPAADTTEQRKSPRCPVCGGPLVRRRRNVLDRLRSLAGEVHRYRCGAFGCGWEGVLPAPTVERRHRRYRN